MASASPPPSGGGDDLSGARERDALVARYGRRLAAGDTLYREGSPAAEAFFLEEGRVRLLKRVAMGERSFAVVKPGDLCGEGALVPGATYGSTAVSLTEALVLALDPDAFWALIRTRPALAVRAVGQLARRLRDAEDRIELTMLRGVESKVTSALLKLAGHTGGGRAEVTVSPVELSARVGLDVDTIKATVARLRERQYVRISGERIEIPDVEALRRLYVLLGVKDELAGPQAT